MALSVSRELNRALQLARINPVIGLPRMAAVIVLGNEVSSCMGLNSHKTHPLAAKFGKNENAICLHAEISAIVEAIRLGWATNLSSATMYVARVLRDGTPALAKPCEGCQRAIIAFGIRNVEWTQ